MKKKSKNNMERRFWAMMRSAKADGRCYMCTKCKKAPEPSPDSPLLSDEF